jgi:plastocyanin
VLLTLAFQSAAAADLDVAIEDSKAKALPGAVVYLTDGSASGAHPPKTAEIDQRNRQFSPRITIVQTGTTITFPNNDTVRHSVYSFSRPHPFQLKLFAGKTPDPILFDKPGIVAVGCNIHDEMAAWILIVDTPVFGQAGADGHFAFHDLKPGVYHLFAWYPGLKEAVGQPVVVDDGAPGHDVRLHLDVVPIEAAANL